VGVSECYYTLFCIESMLERGLFSRKREKFAQNLGVNGKNGNILRESTIFRVDD